MSRERVRKIRPTRSFQKLKNEGYQPLPLYGDEHRLGHFENGSCMFYEDHGCAIHREDGFHAKPTVCQLYPLSLVNTPDGYFISLTFSCPSVIEGGGKPLSQQIESIDRTLFESKLCNRPALPEDTKVQLTGCRDIDWQDYLSLEPRLLTKLQGNSPTRSCLELVASLTDFSLSSQTCWKPPNFSSEAYERVLGLFPYLTAAVISLLECKSDPSASQPFCHSVLSGVPQKSRLLGVELPPLDFILSDDPEALEVRGRFLENFVKGKRLLQDGTVLTRLLALACSLSVQNFYCRLQVQLEWSFDLIERHLLGHSDKFMSLFKDFENRLLLPEHTR